MVYSVDNGKALMGAAFIHYCVYAVFYIVDAIQTNDESEDGAKKSPEKRQGRRDREPRGLGPEEPVPESSQVSNPEGQAELADVKLEHKGKLLRVVGRAHSRSVCRWGVAAQRERQQELGHARQDQEGRG